MKQPSSSKYDYDVDIVVKPWYKRVWCFFVHRNQPAAYNFETKNFRCMKCGVKWQR